MLKKYLWGGVVIFIAGTVFALGGIGGKKGDLLSKAKAGDADAQYMLAEQLEMTTDPVNLKKSEFYYWLKKAAKTAMVRHRIYSMILMPNMIERLWKTNLHLTVRKN